MEIILFDFSRLAVKGIITALDTNHCSVFIPDYAIMLRQIKGKLAGWQIVNEEICYNPNWIRELNLHLANYGGGRGALELATSQ
ncbi:hypothetical protein [Desertivirga brevis]|uniref:hypothetical protein n=1 Tax=Desertivirga brevis TaxID=2810310 RepID=UPI001A9775EE|nr:hypothetical protein [Pedobacter sp. SYSU D00873]